MYGWKQLTPVSRSSSTLLPSIQYGTGPNGCPLYTGSVTECFGYGTCSNATGVPTCSCSYGYWGYSPMINESGGNCQSNWIALNVLRYLSLIPSLLVIILSFGKIRMISARENKKELAKAGYKYEVGSSEKPASGASTSEGGGSTRKKKSADGSDAPTSERESEKEANDAKKSKLAAAKPASPAAAPAGRQQTLGEKVLQFFFEVSVWPKAWIKSDVIKILSIAHARGYISIIMLISMILATPENDATTKPIVIWCWAIGQLGFWGQQTMTIFRFFVLNISAESMKKDDPVIKKVKLFYQCIYFLIIVAQACFIAIAYVPDHDINLKRTLYLVWCHCCGVHCAMQVYLAYYAFQTTNTFLEKSLGSNTNEKQRADVTKLKQKNEHFIKLLKIVAIPACCLFFLQPLIAGLLVSLDYVIMFFTFVSGAVMLSGLRFFK